MEISPSLCDVIVLKARKNDDHSRNNVYYPAPKEEWNRTFGGADDDYAYKVQQTTDGGYIVVGFLGPPYGSEDILLVKTDGNGTMEWYKRFEGKYQDIGYSVQQTSDGGYIIVGSTFSYGVGSADVWMIKTDENGNELWNKTHGGPEADVGRSVRQTADGGYIITGFTGSYGWPGAPDGWLLKTDQNGIEQWNLTWGSPYLGNSDEGHDVELTPDGGYIVVGTYCNADTYDCDVFLLKVDENGIEKWNHTYGTKKHEDEGNGIQVTADGGYIIAGLKGYAKDDDNACDAWLIKTDENGTEQWNKTFGGTGFDWAESVCTTKNGGYVLTGLTSNYSVFNWNVLVVETDCDGNLLWNASLGKPGEDNADIGYSVLQTSDDGYIVAGMTDSYGAGNSDFWLIKLHRFYYPPNPPLITGPTRGNPGARYNFSFTTTDYEQDEVYYWIEWGDTTSSGWIGPYPSGSTAVLNQTYSELGKYDITAKAKDSNGNEGYWSYPHEFFIGNSPPEQPLVSGPHYGKTNTPYSFSIGTVTDPERDPFYCYWDWGDGFSSGWLGPYNSGTSITLSHSWNKSGMHTIKVLLNDCYGAESNWSTPFNITIVQLKKAFFLGTFLGTFESPEDITVLLGGFFFVCPSDSMFSRGRTIVISKEYHGYQGSTFVIGVGGIAVLS